MADVPEQKATGATVTAGNEFTVTVAVVLFTQPFASVPVTEYVVVAVGLAIGL